MVYKSLLTLVLDLVYNLVCTFFLMGYTVICYRFLFYRYHLCHDSNLALMNHPSNAPSPNLSYHKRLLTEGLLDVFCKIHTVAS